MIYTDSKNDQNEKALHRIEVQKPLTPAARPTSDWVGLKRLGSRPWIHKALFLLQRLDQMNSPSAALYGCCLVMKDDRISVEGTSHSRVSSPNGGSYHPMSTYLH